MAKFPDFGYTESDPQPSDNQVDFRPPPPSQAAQDHSSENK